MRVFLGLAMCKSFRPVLVVPLWSVMCVPLGPVMRATWADHGVSLGPVCVIPSGPSCVGPSDQSWVMCVPLVPVICKPLRPVTGDTLGPVMDVPLGLGPVVCDPSRPVVVCP